MSVFSQTISLFKREVLLEQRQKYALYGVLLYLVSTIFVCKFSFSGNVNLQPMPQNVVQHFSGIEQQLAKSVDDTKAATWNSLFWIILLFASVTGVARSFAQESRGRMLYLYTLADPRAVLLAKMIYNTFLMVFLGFGGLLIYAFQSGFPVTNVPLFAAALLLGCIGLGAAFTMISAIASKAGNNFTLMSILGFPVVLPLVLVNIRLSWSAIGAQTLDNSGSWLGALCLLNLVIAALAYLLFPYLWRE